MHSTSIGDVDDMAKLGDLHEASILYNLAKRYKKDNIYVSVSLSSFVIAKFLMGNQNVSLSCSCMWFEVYIL